MQTTRREWIFINGLSALAQQPQRFVGITVMPEYVQSEGIDGVLANLIKRARATAVTTSPYVMEPADAKTGSREPPIDAGAGSVRLLDRPLWGKRELFVRTAPSFTPNRRLYAGLRYQPADTNSLSQKQGGLIRDFLKEAKRRGLKTYLQVQAAIPPGYRVQFGGPQEEDSPRLPDGRIPPKRLANNGSLASPHIRDYTSALLTDLAAQYAAEVDGFRIDWPEYPPYFLDDAFLDFSSHARDAAGRLGIDFEKMRKVAADRYTRIHRSFNARDSIELPELERFKSKLVVDFVAHCRKAIGNKELMPNAFPPPLSRISGMDFAGAASSSTAFSVKLYTMHWPMIHRFWTEQLVKTNPRANESDVIEAVERWLAISGKTERRTLRDLRYPEPEEPHPVTDRAMADKIVAAQKLAGSTPVIALAHGYGPLSDFRRRFKVAYQAAGRRAWVNRYGYLSDAKLDAIGELSS